MSEPAGAGSKSAPFSQAVENFRNNAHNLKSHDPAQKRIAYNKKLLLMNSIVKSIQRGNSLSIVVPETSLELHRMDHDELVVLTAAHEERRHMNLLLAVAAPRSWITTIPTWPTERVVIDFLRNPGVPAGPRAQT